MSIEQTLCDNLGYDHCILFSRARVAIALALAVRWGNNPVFLPSNVCPALPNACARPTVFVPVSEYTGLAPSTGGICVQLYGARQKHGPTDLEIDPLMVGWRKEPQARATIISFGYSKTIDIGYGGALLTNNGNFFNDLKDFADFTAEKRHELSAALNLIETNIESRKYRADKYAIELDGYGIPYPLEQVIPWRFIRRFPGKRDAIVAALRAKSYDVGTNYPPLPGVTDRSAKQWGDEVLNLWLTPEYSDRHIVEVCEIIKTVCDA